MAEETYDANVTNILANRLERRWPLHSVAEICQFQDRGCHVLRRLSSNPVAQDDVFWPQIPVHEPPRSDWFEDMEPRSAEGYAFVVICHLQALPGH